MAKSEATFTYTIRDSSNAEDTGEITFAITGVNDKPTAIDDIKQVNENDNKFFDNAQGLLMNDTDLDGDVSGNYKIFEQAQNSSGGWARSHWE